MHHVPAARVAPRYFVERCFDEGLSKAAVAGHTSADAALASERTYVARTLPRALRRELGALARGDVGGALRAGAIVAGLAVTTAGYVLGRLADRAGRLRRG